MLKVEILRIKIRYDSFKLPSLVNPAPWKEWMRLLKRGGISKATWGRWQRRWAAPPGWRCRPLPSGWGQPGLQKGFILSTSTHPPTWEVPLESIHHSCSQLLLLVPRHGQDHLEQTQRDFKGGLTHLPQRLELALWEPSSKASSHGSTHSKAQGPKGESTCPTFSSQSSHFVKLT